jgi:stalled ribosome alternative rescue factor ArfA
MQKKNPYAAAKRNGMQRTKFFRNRKGKGSYNRKGVQHD